jgi:hypothetical protein
MFVFHFGACKSYYLRSHDNYYSSQYPNIVPMHAIMGGAMAVPPPVPQQHQQNADPNNPFMWRMGSAPQQPVMLQVAAPQPQQQQQQMMQQPQQQQQQMMQQPQQQMMQQQNQQMMQQPQQQQQQQQHAPTQ